MILVRLGQAVDRAFVASGVLVLSGGLGMLFGVFFNVSAGLNALNVGALLVQANRRAIKCSAMT